MTFLSFLKTKQFIRIKVQTLRQKGEVLCNFATKRTLKQHPFFEDILFLRRLDFIVWGNEIKFI